MGHLYSAAPAWLAILGERHPLHDGCRLLFEPTFHAVACLTVERIAGLAAVRLRTLPPAAANRYFWSGGRLLRPGPADVDALPHTLFEAALADDCAFFRTLSALDLDAPDLQENVRDGMPTTTTRWQGGRLLAHRHENPPQGAHLTLCLLALDLAAAHLPDPRARTSLAELRRYLD